MREALAEVDEDVLLADGLDDALIGYTDSWGPEKSRAIRAIYDYERCVTIFVTRDRLTFEQAVEHMEFNVVGAYVGARSPVFMHRPSVR